MKSTERRKNRLLGLAASLLLAIPCTAAPARPLFSEMFQDHAVLQRDRAVPLWGEALPGEELTLVLSDSGGVHDEVHAVSDSSGHWRAQLRPEQAGGPFRLTAGTRGGNKQSLGDILFGDVWLCSGQSNMEFPVAGSLNAAREIAASANDAIRVLSVAHAAHPTPLEHFASPVKWAVAAPNTIHDFSAACYYFARDLQKALHVPMGLIHASWGGSRIEPWMSAGALRAAGDFDAALDVLDTYAGDARAGNDRLGVVWENWWRSRTAAGSTPPWQIKSEGDWRAVPEPMRDWKTWGVAELSGHDGMVWFRRAVTLSKAQAAAEAQLSIGAIDEVDETWVNGRPLANSFGYGTERTYTVPKGWLHPGDNSIVINVLSTWDAGGMYGPPQHMALRFADGSTAPLGGRWRYRFVPESIGLPPRAPWESVGGLTTLYNAMIAPLLPYALRGVLWYQGEANAGEADRYQGLLAGLMADWRGKFAADLPFLIVELPNFGRPGAVPAASAWASLREAQRRAVAADKNAALAVTIDVGEPQELHPPNKQAVGARLARAARHLVYAQPMSPSGPVIRSARFSGDAVVVAFDDVEGRLLAYSAPRPIGFELCGEPEDSCRFVDAEISGHDVRMEPAMTTATRVRFCWGDAPICNLYDESGLPAGPFEVAIEAQR